MFDPEPQIRNGDEDDTFVGELSAVDVADRPLEHADDADVVSVGVENYDLMDVSITATARPSALAGHRNSFPALRVAN
jgi:hypothetical protein